MKKVSIGILVLCLLLAFAMPAQALTVVDVLEEAEANAASAESYEMEMDATIQISDPNSDQSIAMHMSFDGAFIQEPLKAKMSLAFELDMNIPGFDASELMGVLPQFDMYIQTEDDMLVMYIDDGETAMRMETLNYDDLLSQVSEAAVGVSTEDLPLTNYVYHGYEKLNNRNTYIIEAQIDVSMLEDVMMAQLTDEVLADLTRAERKELEDQLKEALNSLKEVKLKFYVDCNTHTYTRIEMDMTSYIKGLLDTLDLGEIEIDAVTMSVDYKNYNRVRNFSVPRAVIERAEEAEAEFDDSIFPFVPYFPDTTTESLLFPIIGVLS